MGQVPGGGVSQRRGGLRAPDSELSHDADLIYRYQGAPFTGTGYDESRSVPSACPRLSTLTGVSTARRVTGQLMENFSPGPTISITRCMGGSAVSIPRARVTTDTTLSSGTESSGTASFVSLTIRWTGKCAHSCRRQSVRAAAIRFCHSLPWG